MMKAAKRYDETRGFKFISYAVWWIRQSILQALAEQSRIVRLPLNKIGSINKINKAYAHLEQENERPPSPEELAEVLDMSEDDIKESMKNSGRHLSMDAPLVEGEDSNLYDVLRSGESPSPDKDLMLESLQIEIERALQTLTPREADLVRLYFGLNGKHPMTLEEIGETFDLTRERVRQIKEKAIKRLKHNTRSKILKSYLGISQRNKGKGTQFEFLFLLRLKILPRQFFSYSTQTFRRNSQIRSHHPLRNTQQNIRIHFNEIHITFFGSFRQK